MEKYKCTYCREYGNLPCEECDKKNKENLTMEKTKFIRVAVEERLPTEPGEYNTEVGTVLFSQKMKSFLSYQGDVIQIDWFLEEIPDREDEMLQMLEKIYESKLIGGSTIEPDLKSLIQSVKSKRLK